MGKISKPQKSRKHKKMKAIDPFYTGDRPSDRNAYKFNLAPRHGDEQELSRGVREIMQLKSVAKSKRKKPRRSASRRSGGGDTDVNENLGVMERGMTRPFKISPEFKQQRGENEASFMRRVDAETNAVIQKSKFEDKFHMDSDSDVKDTPEVTRSGKKMKRLKDKREKLADRRRRKKEDKCGDFKQLKDEVKFGEVAMQPPVLTAKPKRSASQLSAMPQAGSKSKSLLLAKYLTGGASADDTGDDSLSAKPRSGAKRRRHLCLAERVLLDSERERAIQMYRDLKAARMTPAVTL